MIRYIVLLADSNHHLVGQVRQCYPDLLLASMSIVYTLYKQSWYVHHHYCLPLFTIDLVLLLSNQSLVKTEDKKW